MFSGYLLHCTVKQFQNLFKESGKNIFASKRVNFASIRDLKKTLLEFLVENDISAGTADDDDHHFLDAAFKIKQKRQRERKKETEREKERKKETERERESKIETERETERD